jgi:hypothetical protein
VPVLLQVGYCNKNTIGWVAYKQQKFVTHSSGGWKSKIKTGRFGVWCRPTFWFKDDDLMEGLRQLSEASFIRSLISLKEVGEGSLPSCSNYFQKAPLPNSIPLGIKNSTNEFGGTQTSRPQQSVPHLGYNLQISGLYISVVIPKVLSSPVQIHSSHLYSSFALK